MPVKKDKSIVGTPLVLVIDCGTQSLRSALIDPTGAIVSMINHPYVPYHSPKVGWAEKDPRDYWKALCITVHKIREQKADSWVDIIGVSVTVQRDTLVLVDQKGNPLYPAILWLDKRKAKPDGKIPWYVRIGHRIVGMTETVQFVQTDAHINWIRQNQYDLYKNSYKVLQLSGYLNYRLTGRFVDSYAAQIGRIPFDYRSNCWASPNNLNSQMFRIDPEKLPELSPPCEILGQLSTEAAEALNMEPGIPIIATGSDKGCETIGAGCIDLSSANLSLGTTATVQTTSPRFFEPRRFFPPYPSVRPNYYNPEIEIFRGFWMVRWFRDEFGHIEELAAEKTAKRVEVLLDELLDSTPPGSYGLVMQPYWGGGLRNPEAKGAIIGFGEVHSRAYLYRSIIEGLSYAMLDGLHQIERRGSIPAIEDITVSGGGSQSDKICQIIADVFGKPIRRNETHETTILGCAAVCFVGLGVHPSFESAKKVMIRKSDEFIPDAEHHYLYKQLYRHVYRPMYARLKNLYKEIRAITNYPEHIIGNNR